MLQVPINQSAAIVIFSLLIGLISNAVRSDGIPLLAEEIEVADDLEDVAGEPVAISLTQAKQLFDEGVLTDGIGRKVDFRNTIIILTSNIGTKEVQGSGAFGFSKSTEKANYEAMRDRILDLMKGTFNPEFLNRLDETIVYHPLTKEHVLKIIDLQLMDLHENLDKIGLTLSVTKRAKALIVKKGYNPEYGDVKQKEFEFLPAKAKAKSKQKPPPSKKLKKGKTPVKPIDS